MHEFLLKHNINLTKEVYNINISYKLILNTLLILHLEEDKCKRLIVFNKKRRAFYG